MAKKRMINTRFWSDNYISTLSSYEKLLFIYLLTNPFNDICGVYEISVKQMSLDTGLDPRQITQTLDRFSRDDKIHYLSGWIVVKNFIKHQGDSPKVRQGIARSLNDVPDHILNKISEKDIQYPYSISTVSHLNSNSNSNSNLNSVSPAGGSPARTGADRESPEEQKIQLRKNTTFPATIYTQLIDDYQRLKGIQLSGPEFSPIQQAIKSMLLAGRKPVDIQGLMQSLAESERGCWQNWTIDTVKKQMPLYIAGKLDFS